MRARVDQDACISCGVCITMCPEVFQYNADEKSEVVIDEIPGEAIENAKGAKESCPVDAISIE